MATITSTASGNWSDTSKWDLGRVPAAGDAVVIATGHAIAIDVATIPASGTLLSITCQTSGRMTLTLGTVGNTTINCTTWTAGTGATGNSMLVVIGTTTSRLTINGTTLTGGTATNAYGVQHNSNGPCTLNINLVGGSGSFACAFVNQFGALVDIVGNVTGSPGGQTPAVYNVGNATSMTLKGNFILNGSVPWYGNLPVFINTANDSYIQLTNSGRSNKWVTQLAVTDVKSGVVEGDLMGTLAPGSGKSFNEGFQR